jgi:uncharacterized protein YndB with AHSA1/START domain
VSAPERVEVTTVVAADPATAFAAFTDDVDAWWSHRPSFRSSRAPRGEMRFEGGEGGRLVEIWDEAAGRLHELGRILVWKPGDRLVFEWRPQLFRPGESTQVEVRFEPTAAGGTRVTLVHGGWESIPRDHKVRHGWEGEAFRSMIGLIWADLLVALRARLNDAGRRSEP